MSKKLTAAALARFEAKRDVWQEVLDGVKEIQAGGGKKLRAKSPSPIVRARMNTGLTQQEFASLLGVSKRTLEQWEQERRKPSGAAKTLIRVAGLRPEVLRQISSGK